MSDRPNPGLWRAPVKEHFGNLPNQSYRSELQSHPLLEPAAFFLVRGGLRRNRGEPQMGHRYQTL